MIDDMSVQCMNKQQRPMRNRNQSTSTLSSSQQSELTKKQIQPQQQLQLEYEQERDRVIFFLSASISFTTIQPILIRTFNNKLLNIYQTPNRAEMLFEGIIESKSKRKCFLLCCCIEIPQVICVAFNREIIDNKCTLTITNPYYDTPLHDTFILSYIVPLNQDLKRERGVYAPMVWSNFNLNFASPIQVDIHIHKKIYYIFQEGDYSKLQEDFKKSLDHIKDTIKAHNPSHNPQTIIETIISESQQLMDSVQCLYDKKPQSYFHSLLSTDTQRQLSLYCVQESLCNHTITQLKTVYYQFTKAKCIDFNAECRVINQTYTNQQCFEYLNLKKKYRLQNRSETYGSAVAALREIQHATSARMMLLCVQKMFSCMKIECLVAHSGKLQLAGMDQILPVMIFVVARAAVEDFPKYIKIIEDYTSIRGTFQLQEIIIKTLYAGIEDIANKWSIE